MEKQEFTYNFTIKAFNRDEAVRIMTSLQKLARAAETNDLELVANKVEAKPSIIKKALKFL